MPCGGIYPTGKNRRSDCFYCGEHNPAPDHWVEEWDAPIHADCIKGFLDTPEGKIIIAHGHAVYRYDKLVAGKANH